MAHPGGSEPPPSDQVTLPVPPVVVNCCWFLDKDYPVVKWESRAGDRAKDEARFKSQAGLRGAMFYTLRSRLGNLWMPLLARLDILGIQQQLTTVGTHEIRVTRLSS